MIVRMMYILPMLLGRTFDIKKNSVGVDIFSPEHVEKPRIMEESFYESTYKTIESSTDVKDVLQVTGDLSLNIKAGTVAVKGAGSYLKQSLSAQNSVDILTKVRFQTVSKSLSYDARPIADWFKLGRDYLGTHYVKSVLYGGDLIACVSFKAAKAEYLQDIRGVVKASLEAGSALDLVGEGKLEMLNKQLQKKATMEINYFASVPLENIPRSIKGLRELVRNFEQHVKKVNKGIGVPIRVELEELSELNRGFKYLKNADLETELDFFEERFDDLFSTKSRLKSWIEELPDTMNPAELKMISDFSSRLTKIAGKFIDVVYTLDLEKGPDQLSEANEAYREGKGLGMAGKFRKELNRLMRKIVVSNERPRVKGSSVYIHYGSSKCTEDDSTSLVYNGYLVTSSRNSTGAGSNLLCFPEKPDESDPNDYDPVAFNSTEDVSFAAGVKFGRLADRPFEVSDRSVLLGAVCSVCLVNERPTLFVFHGETECPEKGDWTLQYSGYAMSATGEDRSETVCVDTELETHRNSYMGYYDQSLTFVSLMSENVTFVPCVLCTK